MKHPVSLRHQNWFHVKSDGMTGGPEEFLDFHTEDEENFFSKCLDETPKPCGHLLTSCYDWPLRTLKGTGQ